MPKNKTIAYRLQKIYLEKIVIHKFLWNELII